MIDEAEKAWEEWASTPVEQGFPVQVDYRRAFLAGRMSRDAEVEAQQQRIRELEVENGKLRSAENVLAMSAQELSRVTPMRWDQAATFLQRIAECAAESEFKSLRRKGAGQ